ncbi:hypothetical protein BK120_23065 [Paenibacillus sp. FSL A5-0031]|uniref:ATP-binding protein n=1 Tax=Paenibacillus sp. FSL A5-0031 TaxID=1920420 RepID=UPI00096E58B2|nr:ATP-binding protein [Paenibacillus sp. FSL A5-0031]OME78622.1 hypothetical protein BK120_23065 [Paenibacillus sp. FSL A5-0031]
MFINKLNAISYKGLRDLEVNFYRTKTDNPLQISVVVGDNGIGKSSLLQLIADIFCPEQRSKKQKHSKSFKISYDILINTEESKGTASTSYQIPYESDRDYPIHYPTKLIVSSHSAFDPYQAEARYVMRKRPDPKETKYVYCGPNDHNHSSLETAINAILDAYKFYDERILKSYRTLFNKIGYGELINLEVNFEFIPKLIRELDLLVQENNINQIFRAELERHLLILDDKRRSFKRTKSGRCYYVPIEALDLYFLEMLLVVAPLDVPQIIRDIWFLSEDGVSEVPLSEFSSGELTMIYRFLPLVMEIEHNSIILIDEPETHLHPKWAQEFIGYLLELFGDFNTHIILATHSPIIISDVPTESLVILDKANGVISQRLPNDRTFGVSSTDILKDVFFMKQLPGNQSAELIKRIENQLISGDPTLISEARQLYSTLGTTFEKYELFQKFRKHLGE